MIIATSICANYVPKAYVLAKSIKKHMPESKILICLTERELPEGIEEITYFDKVITSKEMGFHNFESYIFRHSIVEASTSVKGVLFQYMYENFDDEELLYLDPDIKVYSPFEELIQLLKTRPIVLCPHLLEPGNIDMELSSTAHGVYNLGFLAVNRSKEARKFIDWWADRLSRFCYDDISRGIFTDQKWIDLAPCFFDVEIFKHHGYDFATWSLLNSDVNLRDDKYYIGNDPLRFIHFSGYDSGTIEWAIDKWLPKGEHNHFEDLYRVYKNEHDNSEVSHFKKIRWSYGLYESGEKVDDKVRQLFREDYALQETVINPFELSNRWFKDNFSKKSIDKMGKTHFMRNAFDVFKREGISSFLRKVFKKIFKK